MSSKEFNKLNRRLDMYADSNNFFIEMQKDIKKKTGRYINEETFWKMFDSMKPKKENNEK